MKRTLSFALALALPASALAQSVAPIRVVKPDDLSRHWVLINDSVVADVPNIARNIHVPGCAVVSFVVEKDGSTSTIKVQKTVPEGDLSRVAYSMAKNMRFEPTVSNAGRNRAFSWLIFPFNAPQDPAARSALMQPCHLEKVAWADR